MADAVAIAIADAVQCSSLAIYHVKCKQNAEQSRLSRYLASS